MTDIIPRWCCTYSSGRFDGRDRRHWRDARPDGDSESRRSEFGRALHRVDFF